MTLPHQHRSSSRKLPFNLIQFLIVACFSAVILLQSLILYSLQSHQDGESSSSSPLSLLHPSSSTRRHDDEDGFHFNPVLRQLHFDSDQVFSILLANHPNPTKHTHVLEVGCYSLTQSAFAASMGFAVKSFDPSPKNFARMTESYSNLPYNQQQLLVLINKAVSNKSGQELVFSTAGGTGDHVEGVTLDQREHRQGNKKPRIDSVRVETVALDDAVQDVLTRDTQNSIYLIKVDVQGHEASVFEGLVQSLGKVRYILFEYWVDALDQAKGVPMGSCSAVESILRPLHNAGYELFDLALQTHPDGGNFPSFKNAHASDFFRPLDPMEHCKWFANRGKEARKVHGYQMGYWTDVLAVYRGDDFDSNEVGDLTLQGRKYMFNAQNYVDSARRGGDSWNERQRQRAQAGLQNV